jgi:hypothetical protein
MKQLLIVAAMAVVVGLIVQPAGDDVKLCWQPTPCADEYRVYWSVVPAEWDSATSVSATARCVVDPAWPPLPDELIYYVVTEVSGGDESDTEHGPIL